MLLSVLFYALLCLLLYCCSSCIKPRNFPPGPRWLPVVGCFPAFFRLHKKHGYMYRAFEELSREYGPVIGLKMGQQRLVVVSTHDLVKKVLDKDQFNGRPTGFFFRVRSFGKEKGVLFTEGSTWQQHRRFTLHQLRLFGLSGAPMERQLSAEAQSLVESLKRASLEGPVAMHQAFDVAVLNALWSSFAGRRFEYEDRQVQQMLQIVHELFRLSDTLGGLMTQLPLVRHLAPGLSGSSRFMANTRQLWAFLDQEIARHEDNLPEAGGEPRDLIDAFLMEIRAEQQLPEARSDSIFDRENLLILCLDLFLAGSKTTTDTLASIFAFLARQPRWLDELQRELAEVVGRDRPPRLEDAHSLPKVEAFLAEAQRVLLLAPMGVPHRTIEDVTLEGYFIPKDTIVLLNFHSVSNDQAYFDEPHEFRPQRFIDENGKFRPINAAMPFGSGKRRCLGERLARASLFMFFTHVLHHFDIKHSEAHGKPDINGYDGFVISPKPYYLELTPRSDI